MSGDGDFEIVRTERGAKAMWHRETGEIMHPEVGPLVEARTLYVEPSQLVARLREAAAEPLRVLDVGLGAGSNAVSALRAALECVGSRRALHVYSFDLTLAPFELALRAEPQAFGFDDRSARAAEQLLAHGVYETELVRWEVRLGDALTRLRELPAAFADIVFWDPFSARVSARLWSLTAFRALHRACRAGASVHTYSGATATRSALLLAGFWVGKGVRTGDKQKHSTLAALPPCELECPLDRAWLEALRTNAHAFPEDAPSDAFEQSAVAAQFG